MSTNRVALVEAALDRFLDEAQPSSRILDPREPLRPGSGLTARQAIEVFEDQVLSRALDVAARELKRQGRGYYTISSAGHEQNAVLGAQLRPTDPCLLHYRSGGLMMARLRQLPGATPSFDTLLSFCASVEDPVSHGRHKVWGSREAWTPPQTSTIASHVPKAVGMAFAIGRARRLAAANHTRPAVEFPGDTIVVCTLGDASVNHASALSGINSARYARRRDNPTPVLFVCEDNERGISVETPRRWIRDFFAALPHMRYFEAQGDLDEVWDATATAIQTCRTTRAPVFLRLSCVRLWGHAGSDVETAYLSLDQIEAIEARDPILLNAKRLIEGGAATPATLRAIVADARDRVGAAQEEAAVRPKLVSVSQIIAPLAEEAPERWSVAAEARVDPEIRARVFGGRLPETVATPTRRTLAAHINHALNDAMVQYPELLVFGEDVGKKGGVYGVSQRLQERFGAARVFDTLLDETTILGVAQGAAMVGLLPVPEIPYLAYLHNAVDQLRGEACSTSFFSDGQFTTPMVVRIASFGYQKGFGGHFHNDNSIAVLRDIPGLLIAAPARGDDAVGMFRTCIGAARLDGRVSAFLEPIARYNTRDLHEPGDGKWLAPFPADNITVPVGQGRLWRPGGQDLTIITYANGVYLSLRAAQRLKRDGVGVRVFDLRWLAPLDLDGCVREAAATGRALVVDEGRRSGGVHEALVSHLALKLGGDVRIGRVTGLDTYIPIGPAADLVLPGEDAIVQTALALMDSP